jgi:hypothetical protein
VIDGGRLSTFELKANPKLIVVREGRMALGKGELNRLLPKVRVTREFGKEVID